MTSERRNWQIDPERLAELVGRDITRDPNHPLWRDERFLSWLAAEAREEHERGRRVSDAEFRRLGEEFMARAHARKLGVVRNDAAATVRLRRTGAARWLCPPSS